jgi:hypothetical protein
MTLLTSAINTSRQTMLSAIRSARSHAARNESTGSSRPATQAKVRAETVFPHTQAHLTQTMRSARITKTKTADLYSEEFGASFPIP